MPPTQIDRFELLRQLAASSSGEVYKAIDPATSRQVAIRTIRNNPAQSASVAFRFLRVALQRAIELDSPNITRVCEIGEARGGLYVVSEYIEGTTVRSLLTRHKFSLWELMDMARQCCLALDHAKSRHIVHWNLTPTNLIEESDGTIKVMDYGLVVSPLEKAEISGSVELLRYASPEQLAGEVPTTRSNLYSLGAVLYHMASGRQPFDSTQLPDIVDAIANQAPDLAQLRRSDLPPALSKVILRSLAKAPEDRFASGAELIGSLDESLKRESMPRVGPPGPVILPGAAPLVTPPTAMRAATFAPAATIIPATPALAEALDVSVRPPVATATPEVGPDPSSPSPTNFLVIESRFNPAATPTIAPRPPGPQPSANHLVRTHRLPAPRLAAFGLVLVCALVTVALQRGVFLGRAFRPAQAAPSPARQATTLPAATAADAAAKTTGSTAPIALQPDTPTRPAKSAKPLLIAAPKVATAEVFIDSIPRGVDIEIDGHGGAGLTTPYTAVLKAGTHTIALNKSGYIGESRITQLKAGTNTKIRLALAEIKVALSVTSEPAGAVVWIDNLKTGRVTPLEATLPQGSHTIVLRKAGFFDEEGSFELSPEQSSRYSVRLSPMGDADQIRSAESGLKGGTPQDGATLRVRSIPPGAQIRINQRLLEKVTPADFMVPAGTYDITLTLPGCKPFRRKRLSIGGGSDSVVGAVLKP